MILFRPAIQNGELVQLFARHRPGTYTRGEDTRRRILDTALEIFASEGYEGASTRLLAERAGVNLPAIQYYFGSKEGLFRAVIDSFIEHTEVRMAPLAGRVKAALADPSTSRAHLLELLCALLEAFVALVTEGARVESKRLLYARSEVEDTPGFELLHESGMRQVFQPCLELTARLIERPAEDEQTRLRAMAVLGQVTIFCHKGIHRALESPHFTPERIQAIQALVRTHTRSIFEAHAGDGEARP
jgi:TetR/AcrR family transcriptional regulator, regulator of cefoperazone and chloramphenicol sensitivity